MRSIFLSNRFAIGFVSLILSIGISNAAFASDCITNVQSTSFTSDTNWLSPFSGIRMASAGALHSSQQYFTVAVSYRGQCEPSDVKADLSVVPMGINMALYEGPFNSYMNNDPSLKVTYLVYFVSADPLVPEKILDFNIPILEGSVVKAMVPAELKIDKTGPQTLASGEILAQCIELSLNRQEHIRVDLAPPPLQPNGQSPIQLIYSYDTGGNRLAYGLYNVNEPASGTSIFIYPKDYGKPIRFKRVDQAGNLSEYSQEFVFSSGTVNARLNKKLNRCVAR